MNTSSTVLGRRCMRLRRRRLRAELLSILVMRNDTVLLTGRVELFLNIRDRRFVHFSWKVARLAVVNESSERSV